VPSVAFRSEVHVKPAIIGVAAAIVVSGGCGSPERDAPIETAALTLPLSRATIEDVESSFEAGGVVRPRVTALIASRVMAPISQVHVRTGDRVRDGSLLVTLDTRDIHAEKARAEAASRSAAELARAADADLRTAESALVLARATHDRMAGLHAKKSATPQELDQAIAALKAAEAQTTSARSRLAAADAARVAAQAAAEAATITATYAELRASFDGVVTERHADPGSMAMPGSPLLTLEDPATYRLEVQVDEARAASVKTGQPVSVQLDNAPADTAARLDGRVVEIARVDPASHSFLVKIDLPPSATVQSGLFGRARFPGAPRRVLTVPTSSLVERGQLTFVYRVDAERRVRLRPVSVAAPDGDRVEVLAGLREGDEIVTSPSPSLIDGARVTGGQP
jgi:multidrug efflux pump subunit AcrA (membrane-fusion protein)